MKEECTQHFHFQRSEDERQTLLSPAAQSHINWRTSPLSFCLVLLLWTMPKRKEATTTSPPQALRGLMSSYHDKKSSSVTKMDQLWLRHWPLVKIWPVEETSLIGDFSRILISENLVLSQLGLFTQLNCNYWNKENLQGKEYVFKYKRKSWGKRFL